MAETTKPVSAVFGSLANILKELSVEKGGTLPGNMGGKPYITAVDLSLEIKRQFVENKLIILPSERVVKTEILTTNNRTTVTVLIEGTYTIVSTVDESAVTIQGIGDGLAIGTAVASNIASTNALKNALLRTFLVTEQSAEDAAKNGIPEVEQKAAAEETLKLDDIRAQITAKINDKDSPYTGAIVNALGLRITGIEGSKNKWAVEDFAKILDAMNSDEVA